MKQGTGAAIARGAGFSAWAAIVIAAAFYLFEFMARLEPSLAPDRIAEHFHLSDAGFATLASAFFWVYAPMQIAVGLLLDRYGARTPLLLGSCVCALGAALFTAADGPFLGAAGRLMTGFGASFAFVGALYLVNHWFPPSRFALLSGVVNAIGMIGAAIGSVLLSDLIETLGWRPVFFGTAGFGALVFLAALLLLRDAPGSPAPTAEAMTAHIREQLGAVLSDRRTWLIAVLGMLYYVPINVFGVLWGHEALRALHGLTDIEAQTAVSMIFWGMALGGVAFGALSDALGHRKWLILAGILATTAGFSALLYLPMGSTALIGAVLFASGFFAGGQMLTFAAAKEARSLQITGTIVAFVNMVGIGGAMIFEPLTGYLLGLFGHDFAAALSVMPIALAAAAALTLALREERHEDHLDAPSAR